MTEEWHRAAFHAALRAVQGGPPRNLVTRAMPDAEDRGLTIDADDLAAVLVGAAVVDPFLADLGMQVHLWDAADPNETWTENTAAGTLQRREVICRRLGLNDVAATALLAKRPLYTDQSIVITAPWSRWYGPERAAERDFYWSRYRDHLLRQRRWPQENVTALDLATTRVVERLADPTRREAHQAKGLVVGYVQSGKTANFTGVIAKAIDAGYRLVIVLTGTIEMLRAQTQRRMDMEMVGRWNIVGEMTEEEAVGADYQDDPDWRAGRFLDLGEGPVPTQILRLTTHREDYKSQFETLRIERFDAARPLYDPVNLYSTRARLVVTKKNSTVLRKLVTDLRANRTAFAEVPVLIIDDESDQASVNTVDPDKVRAARDEGREIAERRAVNQRIADMLELLPRAQYVGYTATPFANVFVDPSDEQGIFPKDFVIGLGRPPGYMGVEDFHDLDEGEPPTDYRSNRRAHVRDLRAEEDSPERSAELATALDMFVLTGACKLYRRSVDSDLAFRHHTMLIHESVRTEEHRDLAQTVRRVWRAAAYSGPAGKRRLRELYDRELLPVSAVRREDGVPELPPFDALQPHLAAAIARITEHDGNPVLVVNSDREIEQQQLDFDRIDTWRVLIGGAKLSRGFTVEGLTVTYFRRAVTMSDSLTQMGRWFGFRHGYRDLVRLYIDREARFGRSTVDLYDAFEAVALDERAFREQLALYAEWENDEPRVLPAQIPPLVSQHLPWLKPTARNKMFNAVLTEQAEASFNPSGYPARPDDLHHNLDRWRSLLAAASRSVPFPTRGAGGSLRAYVGVVSASDLVAVVEEMRWLDLYRERSVTPATAFHRRLLAQQPSPLTEFLLVLPQPDTGRTVAMPGVGPRAVISRDRRPKDNPTARFGEMTEPAHRRLVEPLLRPDRPGEDTPLADWWSPTRGVILAYLACQSEHAVFDLDPPPSLPADHVEYGLVLGFRAALPDGAVARRPRALTFQVRDHSRADQVVVPAS